jgi:hypothetical protein
MADDLPGPPGGRRDDQPGERPTEPLGPTPPPPPPPPSDAPTTAEPGYSPPAYQPGYGQPGYGPQGYGQPGYGQGYGYGYPTVPQTDSSATAALIIAIVGFFICPPVGAVVALIMANSAQKRIEASGGRLTGLDQAKAARIIAIIELVLSAVVLLIGVLVAMASLGARY